jgi:Rod binding domain-containing protein
MSSSSTNVTLGTIGSDAGIPNLNVATIPANIRNGDSKAKAAYSQGLAFEDMLVNELSQQLATTMYGGDSSDGTDGSSTDGTSGSSDGSSGSSMLGGSSAYASMIPQALTSSIMNGGGLGMAESFAQELDPSLLSQASATTSSSAAGATSASPSTTTSSTTDEASGANTGAVRPVSL